MLRTSLLLLVCSAAYSAGFQSADLRKLRSVGTVQFSPDGSRLAYTVTRNDGPLQAISQLWIMTVADGKSICLSSGDEPSSDPEWSPDGKWIVYSGRLGDHRGMIIARPDGTGKRFLTTLESTNCPLPTTGKIMAWSPDSKQIAYVSAQPGPETADATGDPIVITRYLYKPTASEGNSHFNDNKRLHISVIDSAPGRRGNLPAARTTSTRSRGRRTVRKSRSSPIARRTKINSSITICSRSIPPTERSAGSPRPRAPNTSRTGHPMARLSPTLPPSGVLPIWKRPWKIRTYGWSTRTAGIAGNPAAPSTIGKANPAGQSMVVRYSSPCRSEATCGCIECLPPAESRHWLSKRRAALARGPRKAIRSHSRSPLPATCRSSI